LRRAFEIPLGVIRPAKVVEELGHGAGIAQFASKLEALQIDHAGRLLMILQVFEESDVAECPRDSVAVVDGAEDRQPLVQPCPRLGVAALDEQLPTEAVEQFGDRSAVVELPRDGQPDFEQRSAGRKVRKRSGQHRSAEEGQRQRRRG
jgi:hypothetical protein